MTLIVKRAKDVIEQCSSQLEQNGVKIEVSKRYFEIKVQERPSAINNRLLHNLKRKSDRKAEISKDYNYQNNRYHVIALTLHPTEKGILPLEHCKEYAFVIKKIERDHVGMTPEETKCKEDKIILKIQKRISKILKLSQKINVRKLCKNTFFDALRYSSWKYKYKRKFLNIDRDIWQVIFLVLSCIIALLITFLV